MLRYLRFNLESYFIQNVFLVASDRLTGKRIVRDCLYTIYNVNISCNNKRKLPVKTLEIIPRVCIQMRL